MLFATQNPPGLYAGRKVLCVLLDIVSGIWINVLFLHYLDGVGFNVFYIKGEIRKNNDIL